MLYLYLQADGARSASTCGSRFPGHPGRAAGHEARRLRSDEGRASLKQFEIFRNKHTWAMTILYIVTFGSFIGFSMALPLSMKVVFGVSHVPDANGVMQHTLPNPNGPAVLAFALDQPFVGALIRPVGGWISDKVGASIVTQWISAVMVAAAVAVGYVMMKAYQSATPEGTSSSSRCSWSSSPPAASATARPSAPSA